MGRSGPVLLFVPLSLKLVLLLRRIGSSFQFSPTKKICGSGINFGSVNFALTDMLFLWEELENVDMFRVVFSCSF